MKKAKRLPWETLGEILESVDYDLCCFCRYCKPQGTACDPGWLECGHPFSAISDRLENNDCLIDRCWGFQPEKDMSLSLAADIVGILLQGYYPSYWIDGREITPHEARVFDRLVCIGELKPWILKEEIL